MIDYQHYINVIQTHIGENLDYYTVIFAAILGKVKESSKNSMLTAWSIRLIGTFFHELAHFLISVVTWGKPVLFSIIPSSSVKDGQKYYTLGYVENSNVRWYNGVLISMAPLLLLPLSFWVYYHFFDYFETSIVTYFLYIFTVVSLVFSAIPSDADFSVMFKSLGLRK